METKEKPTKVIFLSLSDSHHKRFEEFFKYCLAKRQNEISTVFLDDPSSLDKHFRDSTKMILVAWLSCTTELLEKKRFLEEKLCYCYCPDKAYLITLSYAKVCDLSDYHISLKEHFMRWQYILYCRIKDRVEENQKID